MSVSSPNPYLRTKVVTASPGELRLMLLDGAIRFLEQGRQGIEDKNPETTYTGISRCQQIIMELLGSLRPEEAPELCERMSGLYTFMYLQLVTACTERDITVADAVLELLRYERETWALLLARLSADGEANPDGSPAAAPETTRPGPRDAADGADTENGTLGRRVSVKG